MAVEINGDGLITVDGTTSTQGRVRLKEDADNGSNYVELTAPASVTANRTITFPDDTGTVLTNSGNQTGVFSALTVNSNNISADNSLGFRNRIINGAMVIDQRNAGASVTPTANTYTLDRWLAVMGVTSKYSVQRNAGSVTPPAGFVNYLGITSTSAYSSGTNDPFLLNHYIEGFNVSDLGWGTASAKSITISFWVRSSLTGTFSLSVCNQAASRNYIATYTISSANTWEYETITIPGDTTGTWLTDNSIGVQIRFDLGSGSGFNGTAGSWGTSNLLRTSGSQSVVGTNGATFYITGVQLEVGTVATPFERRPYGTELALCQRYYFRFNPAASGSNTLGVGFADSSTSAQITHFYPVPMRAAPTALEQSGTAGNYAIRYTGAGVATCSSVPTFSDANVTNASVTLTVASGLTGGQAVAGRAVNTNAWLAWSAEL